MKQLFLILILAYILAACSNGPTNPLGMTTRTELRANAHVNIAQADADARIEAAQADERARIAEAQAKEAADIAASNASIISEQTRQNGTTVRALAWATKLPIILLIMGATLVIALVINWQGRIWYARAVQAGLTLTAYRPHALNADQMQLLQDYAAQTGKQLRVINGKYYLQDANGHTYRARLKG